MKTLKTIVAAIVTLGLAMALFAVAPKTAAAAPGDSSGNPIYVKYPDMVPPEATVIKYFKDGGCSHTHLFRYHQKASNGIPREENRFSRTRNGVTEYWMWGHRITRSESSASWVLDNNYPMGWKVHDSREVPGSADWDAKTIYYAFNDGVKCPDKKFRLGTAEANTPKRLTVGSMRTPIVRSSAFKPPKSLKKLGWYGKKAHSKSGTTVLTGKTGKGGKGKLDNLRKKAKRGKVISVSGDRYRVISNRIMSKKKFARESWKLKSQSGPHRLVIVIRKNYKKGTAKKNIVIVAKLR